MSPDVIQHRQHAAQTKTEFDSLKDFLAYSDELDLLNRNPHNLNRYKRKPKKGISLRRSTMKEFQMIILPFSKTLLNPDIRCFSNNDNLRILMATSFCWLALDPPFRGLSKKLRDNLLWLISGAREHVPAPGAERLAKFCCCFSRDCHRMCDYFYRHK